MPVDSAGENGDVWQVPVQLGGVEPVADDKVVRDLEPDVIDGRFSGTTFADD